MMKPYCMFFFDHLDHEEPVWAACKPSEPQSCIFGPTKSARKSDPSEAGLVLREGETPLAAAKRIGAVIKVGEWLHLIDAACVDVSDDYTLTPAYGWTIEGGHGMLVVNPDDRKRSLLRAVLPTLTPAQLLTVGRWHPELLREGA